MRSDKRYKVIQWATGNVGARAACRYRSSGLTAHRPVNAIAAVCEGAPGIRTTADLPQIIARFGM
ncbi:MAG: hypothetical protein ACSLE1_05715 [Sphingobium sp.]